LFEEIFNRFYEKNREIKVIGVWGKDGIVLEKKYFRGPGVEGPGLDIDVEFSGAELADIISKLDQTKTSSGGTYFLRLNYNNYLLMLFSLTNDYFLMILTGADILEGRLKFYLSLYKEQLIAAL
jgi:hypothetical protein